jgi:hypothetical protein
MSLAQWLGWLLSIPISVGLAWLLAFLLSVPRRIWRTVRKAPFRTIWETNLGLPLKCILAIVIHAILVYLLEPPLLYRTYYYRFLAALLVGCLSWLVGKMTDRGFELAVNRRRTTGKGGESVLLLVQRVITKVIMISLDSTRSSAKGTKKNHCLCPLFGRHSFSACWYLPFILSRR